MQAYIARRVLWAVPTLLGALTILFIVMNVLPGDVALVILGSQSGRVDPAQYEALREQLGLSRPLWEQYFVWLWGLLHGDMGISMWTGLPVFSSIGVRMPYTLTLVVLSMLVIVATSIPVGVISALKKDTCIDYVLRSTVIAGISIPNFYFGMLILLAGVLWFGWSPPLDYATIWESPGVALQQLALPAITLGFRGSTASARMVRSCMLEVLSEDYIRTARSKGLLERTVIYVHALRNAILPVITMFGMELIFLFAGTVVVETVFRIPGMGFLLLDAIKNRDVILVEGIVLIIISLVLVVNILVDVLYGWLDPRVRLG